MGQALAAMRYLRGSTGALLDILAAQELVTGEELSLRDLADCLMSEHVPGSWTQSGVAEPWMDYEREIYG